MRYVVQWGKELAEEPMKHDPVFFYNYFIHTHTHKHTQDCMHVYSCMLMYRECVYAPKAKW